MTQPTPNLADDFVSAGPAFLPRDRGRSSHLQGYSSLSDNGRTVLEAPPVQHRQPKGNAQRQAVATPSTSEDRYALNVHMRHAAQSARDMEEAAAAGDFMSLASEGIELHRTLSDLWRLRHLRGEDWASVINFLQAVVAQKDFEEFNAAQCTALREVLTRHSGADCGPQDVSAVIRILRKAGFNPWLGISDLGGKHPDAEVNDLP